MLPDRTLQNKRVVSTAFMAKGITTFQLACAYIKSLPYGRNNSKDDIFCVIKDNCGTCSTKHALLKRLADENGLQINLMVGIYKMTKDNTQGLGNTLAINGLDYIPEAHNYLIAGDIRFDFTFPKSKSIDFKEEILQETEILPEQITDYKATLHKNFLRGWLLANNNLNLSFERLWEIREECIANLSMQQ